jgi:hypothetical protein
VLVLGIGGLTAVGKYRKKRRTAIKTEKKEAEQL